MAFIPRHKQQLVIVGIVLVVPFTYLFYSLSDSERISDAKRHF